MSEARSIHRAEILTAHTDAAAEVAEVAAAEAAAAEAAAAVEASAAAKAAADALGARKALAPALPKQPGGGAGCMTEDADEIPGRSMFSAGGRKELKARGGSLSSEGANAAVQAERSKPIKFLRSLQYTYALILNAITTIDLSSEFIFVVSAIPALYNF